VAPNAASRDGLGSRSGGARGSAISSDFANVGVWRSILSRRSTTEDASRARWTELVAMRHVALADRELREHRVSRTVGNRIRSAEDPVIKGAILPRAILGSARCAALIDASQTQVRPSSSAGRGASCVRVRARPGTVGVRAILRQAPMLRPQRRRVVAGWRSRSKTRQRSFEPDGQRQFKRGPMRTATRIPCDSGARATCERRLRRTR